MSVTATHFCSWSMGTGSENMSVHKDAFIPIKVCKAVGRVCLAHRVHLLIPYLKLTLLLCIQGVLHYSEMPVSLVSWHGKLVISQI